MTVNPSDSVGPETKDAINFVHPEFLVETSWLEEHLKDAQLRVLDCTFRITFNPRTMVQIASGREDFEQGHIPGAQFVDVVAELSGRGTVPNAEQFAAVMSSLGVGDGTKVVLYSAQNAYWACRVWWLLRVFGFDSASVLNGGWQKWRREGRPTETGPAKSKPRARFIVSARPELMARREDVLAAIGDEAICTVNALPRDQHLFTSGVHYGRPGHIKGSVNVPSTDLLNPETNEFLSADELYRRFQRVEAFNKKVITYCGGGAAASADAMALVMLGHTDVKLYDGSLLEWAADPDLPMEADPVPTSPDQALINIENSGLVTQLREALEWQTATTEILDIIIRSPGNVDPVFDAILEKVISLGDAAHCILWSINGTAFRSAASRGLGDQTSESRFMDRTIGLLARLIRGDPLVHIADISADQADEFAQAGEDFSRPNFMDQGRARTLLMVPLQKGGELVGALSAYRQRVQLFTDNQINLVQHLASQAVIAIENARLLGELRQRTEEVAELNRGLEARVAEQVEELGRVGRLKRFLAPQLAELIVSRGDEKILESHRREIVVVFCDLRGYTAFTETAEPEEVLDFLREFHGALGPLVSQFEGTLDQFSGDGIMVLFNDPVPCPDPAERAVKMAIAMREAAAKLIAAWRRHGCELGFGVGIAQGYATLGQIGFAERAGYTAIGTVCNLAARLCAEAKDGQILVSTRVADEVDAIAQLENLGNLDVKGLRRPVAAFNVGERISEASAHP